MKRVYRSVLYLLGALLLALGITLNTKTGLGVSPIISVSYCISEIWHLNFGDMTSLLYASFVAAQFVIRGRKSHWYDLLQLVVSVVFGWLLNLFAAWIPYESGAHGLPANFALLLLAVVLTGIGAAMMVDMQLIPNPGDGIVQAIAERVGWGMGLAKNVFDVGCVTTTVLIGLVVTGQVIGISIGTLVAMVGVGRVVALTNRLFKDKMMRLAGMAG